MHLDCDVTPAIIMAISTQANGTANGYSAIGSSSSDGIQKSGIKVIVVGAGKRAPHCCENGA